MKTGKTWAGCKRNRPGRRRPAPAALEARPRGLYRHRHPGGVLSGHAKTQAVVNPGLHFLLRVPDGRGDGQLCRGAFCYENGITDYLCEEMAGRGQPDRRCSTGETKRQGRDREDKDEYKVKLSVAFCFSNRVTASRVLPQLLLPGARRLPRAGGASRRLRGQIDGYLKPERQVPQEREQDHLPGRGGLPGAGLLLLFHPDLL